MSMLTDDEQMALLTDSTIRKMEKAIAALGIVSRLNVATEVAQKAWEVAQKIERRQKERTEADVRAWAAHLATLKANVKE